MLKTVKKCVKVRDFFGNSVYFFGILENRCFWAVFGGEKVKRESEIFFIFISADNADGRRLKRQEKIATKKHKIHKNI